MSIFAIADLHLSHKQDKPMDVFGDGWDNHPEKLKENWNSLIREDDLVIVAGDISWAMRLEEALPDLHWLGALMGSKLLIRGNHDYWWSSIGKVRSNLPASIYALQNDYFEWGEYVICGTRGWNCPGDQGFDNEEDQKIYLREVQRLQLSLESGKRTGGERIIAALHFPPFNRKNEPSAFTSLLEEYGVEICIFGHIHDQGRDYIFQGQRNGVCYKFVAADGLDFKPLRLV